MKRLRLRHLVALNDRGLNVSDYELIRETADNFTFRNKETKKIVDIRY